MSSPADAGRRFAAAASGVQGDEDRLPFADHAFDLIVSVGALDSVNDLPGALTLIRRALRPDGLFLAAFAGAGSLPRLRAAMRAAEEAEDIAASPHIHPQIDVRAAGDLLGRAGFALPVVDSDGRHGALQPSDAAGRRPSRDGRDQSSRRAVEAPVRPPRPRRRHRPTSPLRPIPTARPPSDSRSFTSAAGHPRQISRGRRAAAAPRPRLPTPFARRADSQHSRVRSSDSSSPISGRSAGGISSATISAGRSHLSALASSGRGSPRQLRQM